MNASELKYNVDKSNPYFFTSKTMKFFGDTMRNYGVRSATIQTHWNKDNIWTKETYPVEVWELYRKHPVKNGLQDSAYFDKVTFEKVHNAESENY